MIFGWFFGKLINLIAWFIQGIPAPTVPSWLSTLDSAILGVVGFINDLGAWIPSELLVTVIYAYVSVFILSITIKVTRILVSLFTGGGGNVS